MISVGGEEGFERVHDGDACAGAISVMSYCLKNSTNSVWLLGVFPSAMKWISRSSLRSSCRNFPRSLRNAILTFSASGWPCLSRLFCSLAAIVVVSPVIVLLHTLYVIMMTNSHVAAVSLIADHLPCLSVEYECFLAFVCDGSQKTEPPFRNLRFFNSLVGSSGWCRNTWLLVSSSCWDTFLKCLVPLLVRFISTAALMSHCCTCPWATQLWKSSVGNLEENPILLLNCTLKWLSIGHFSVVGMKLSPLHRLFWIFRNFPDELFLLLFWSQIFYYSFPVRPLLFFSNTLFGRV